ncbi:MAG TPA: hypothetical protein VLZ77_12920 [Acidimicrobiales bacterium]|nr:hypothetical protein [Acidimicrobiales bacterium]
MRRPRVSTVVGAGFVLWGVAIGLARLHDNSYLTHVATGRLILAHGVPTTDPYTFTAQGRPWVVESWLASLLYGVVERVAGGHGLQVMHGVLGAVLGGLGWVLTRPARQLVGRILAAAALLSVGTGYWSPRPLLIALVLLALLAVMAEADRGPLWPAVLVMWVWVNVHGSWPLALVYLVVRMAGRRAEGRGLGRLPALTGFSALGCALGAANPIGLRLLSYPLVVFTHHAAFSHIAEWETPDFSDPTNALFLGAVLLAVVLLVARRGTVEDVAVVAVFSAAALSASRNVPVAAVVLVPVLARGLAGLGTVDGTRRSVVTVAALGLLAVLGGALVDHALARPAFDLAAYPVTEVTWMQDHGLAPGRVVAPDYVGNYLEFRYGARAQVFVDDRVDVFPAAVERDYGTLLAGGPGWESVLDRHHVDVVLWPRSDPLASLLARAPGWREPVRDARWVVAVRRGAGAGRPAPARAARVVAGTPPATHGDGGPEAAGPGPDGPGGGANSQA